MGFPAALQSLPGLHPECLLMHISLAVHLCRLVAAVFVWAVLQLAKQGSAMCPLYAALHTVAASAGIRPYLHCVHMLSVQSLPCLHVLLSPCPTCPCCRRRHQ